MKISVVADSLSLPRIDGTDVVSWEQTWPFILEYLLKQEWNDAIVINFGKRNRTVETLAGEDYKEFYTFINPEIIILQVGVVDGLPRIISKKERRLMNMTFFPSWLREYIIKIRKARRQEIIRKNPMKRVWTKPNRFSRLYRLFIERVLKDNPRCIILAVPILIQAQKMELISPGASDNAFIYNQLINEACRGLGRSVSYLQVSDKFFDSELFTLDGYHLSSNGNFKLAICVKEQINEILHSNRVR